MILVCLVRELLENVPQSLMLSSCVFSTDCVVQLTLLGQLLLKDGKAGRGALETSSHMRHRIEMVILQREPAVQDMSMILGDFFSSLPTMRFSNWQITYLPPSIDGWLNLVENHISFFPYVDIVENSTTLETGSDKINKWLHMLSLAAALF